MDSFEILCVTMHQGDFAKIEQMNIHSNVVFANQCDHTSYEEIRFQDKLAKMISTQTRGVGINRNLALTYATADICLLADDDVVYCDDMERKVVAEFNAHPNADVFIFHLDTTDEVRKQVKYKKTAKYPKYKGLPWGAFRIAFRLEALRKANVWFTTLFGGGCIFPSGEDSLFLTDMRKKGLKFYVSKETIGMVSFENSTWFTGADEKYYYGKGAYYECVHKKSFWIWALYFALRTKKASKLNLKEKLKWMKKGKRGFKDQKSYLDIK